MDHISQVIWQFLVKWMTNFALFPPEASKIAPQMDALYFFITLVSLIGLTLVVLLVTSFSILYRKERHPKAVQIEGSTLLEATWTIIPLAIFLDDGIPHEGPRAACLAGSEVTGCSVECHGLCRRPELSSARNARG